jgi:hypothetical protein
MNQEFLEDLHQFELDDWGRYGKARQSGKSISEILTTFLFMRKNARRNWPDNARNTSPERCRRDDPREHGGSFIWRGVIRGQLKTIEIAGSI